MRKPRRAIERLSHRARTWLAMVVCLLPLVVLAIPDAKSDPITTPSVMSQAAPRDIVVATVDGLLTATFPETADDAVLKAAIPGLIARGVQSISLKGVPIRDIRPLAGMPDLRAANLCGTQVRDLTPLARLTALRSLNLQFSPIGDLRPLSGLTSLQSLNAGGTDVQDLAPLAGLANLQELVLSVTKVRALAPLAALRRLTSLNLDSSGVSDLRPLAGLDGMQRLSLNGTPVADLQPLAGLTALRRLDVGGTQVSDVRPLARMKDLAELNLEGTKVADVAPLTGLTRLRALALAGSLVPEKTGPASPAIPSTPASREERAASNPVLFWIVRTNRAIQAEGASPFHASRALALESIAVLDTIRSINGAPAYQVRLPAPRGIPTGPAVSAAAHTVLTQLFPARKADLDAALTAALAHEPSDPARERAIAFGRAVADGVLAARGADVSSGPRGANRVSSAPGQWRSTPPDFLPAAETQWAAMKPFAMIGPGQFRPQGPPALESVTFWEAKAAVVALGAARSVTRTPAQTEAARYWADGPGTYTPPGHWNAIAMDIVAPLGRGLAIEAEVFAELNVALADSAIAAADAKYHWWFWRPVTAIRMGGYGEPAIPDWTPLLETPNHPSYVSGHAAFSGAASTILTAWFGTQKFSSAGPSLPGAGRSFTSFQHAAEEAALSRVFGGLHFPFDNADGLTVGRAVAAWTLSMFQRTAEERGPVLMLDPPGMTATLNTSAVTGCALSNLSPVTAVSAQLEGLDPFEVAVDERGAFAVPVRRLSPPGRHRVTLTATSVTGRRIALHLEVETNGDGQIVGAPVLIR